MALSLETLLPTPYGWTSVHHLKVGDILFDEYGYPTKVTHVSEAYLAPGATTYFIRDIHSLPNPRYSVTSALTQTFPAGTKRNTQYLAYPRSYKPDTIPDRYTELPPNWPTFTLGDIPRDPKPKPNPNKPKPIFLPKSVSTMSERLQQAPDKTYHTATSPQYHIPVAGPLQLPDRKLPHDPYIQGISTFLAFSERIMRMRVGIYPGIAKSCKERRKTISKMHHNPDPSLFYQSKYVKPIGRHTFPTERFVIPTQILRSSAHQRMEFLRGYMDTVKEFHPAPANSAFIFIFGARDLKRAEALNELLLTLGQIPELYAYQENDWEHGPSLKLNWAPTINPFTIKKLELSYHHLLNSTRSGLFLRTWKVKAVEQKGDILVREITVDSPHQLYLSGELMIPTKDDA